MPLQSHPRARLTLSCRALLVALVAACGGSDVTNSSAVSGISLSPQYANIMVGSTIAVEALVAADGSSADVRNVFWSSSDTTIAVVSPVGVVTGRRPGSASIAATAFGTSAVAAITVSNPSTTPPVTPPTTPPTPPPTAPPTTPAAVATVTVSLADAIGQDNTAQATAVLRSASGTILSGRTVTWASSNPSIASINGSGVVTGKKQGTVTITATSEGKQGSKSLVILKD